MNENEEQHLADAYDSGALDLEKPSCELLDMLAISDAPQLSKNAMSTLFEKIIAREIPAKIEYEDDQCIVIHDIDPKAPTHFLVIPKKVIPRVAEAQPEDAALLGHLLLTASSVAKSLNLEGGFRIVINNGKDGGEAVPHLHVHVLGGRAMAWPPG